MMQKPLGVFKQKETVELKTLSLVYAGPVSFGRGSDRYYTRVFTHNDTLATLTGQGFLVNLGWLMLEWHSDSVSYIPYLTYVQVTLVHHLILYCKECAQL